jgi:hypothetical protein
MGLEIPDNIFNTFFCLPVHSYFKVFNVIWKCISFCHRLISKLLCNKCDVSINTNKMGSVCRYHEKLHAYVLYSLSLRFFDVNKFNMLRWCSVVLSNCSVWKTDAQWQDIGVNGGTENTIIIITILLYYIYSPSIDLYRYAMRHTVYISMQGICHNTIIRNITVQFVIDT